MPTELFIETPAQLSECCDHLASCPVIGFDTEFVGEQTYVPELCLIQVATPHQLFLIDPFGVESLDRFWRLLAEPHRTVVVHAGREEVRLCQRACGHRASNFFDVQIAAGFIGLDYPLGHANLVRELLNVRLHKGETLTDWRKRPLAPRQIEYAYDDVRHLLELRQVVSDRIEKLGRSEWVREEQAQMLVRSFGEDPSVERWRKLRGLGTMEPRKLAMVAALFDWREQKAAERNRPVRTILRDDLIVEIARRVPRSAHDLELLRGVPKRDVPELYDLVKHARDLPKERWPKAAPRIDDDRQVLLVSGLMNAVLADLCQRRELSTSLAASANDVRQLVRSLLAGEDVPADSPFASGWRASILLPELQAVLAGKVRLRIAAANKSSPLEYSD